MRIYAMNRWIKRGAFGLLGLTLLLGSGCVTQRLGDFTVLSNKTMRISDVDLGTAEKQHVVGEDIVQSVFPGIFWGTMPPTLFGALDDAFKKTGGDVMVDATVKFTSRFYLVYSRATMTVEGDVIKTRKN